jgi:hypothetical protein
MKNLITLVLLFFITIPLAAQFAEVADVVQWCNRNTGAIQIEIIQGDPEDYYYVWSHDGSSELEIDGLEPGLYSF